MAVVSEDPDEESCFPDNAKILRRLPDTLLIVTAGENGISYRSWTPNNHVSYTYGPNNLIRQV